jgi:flagellar biosynthesis component FlhA
VFDESFFAFLFFAVLLFLLSFKYRHENTKSGKRETEVAEKRKRAVHEERSRLERKYTEKKTGNEKKIRSASQAELYKQLKKRSEKRESEKISDVVQ